MNYFFEYPAVSVFQTFQETGSTTKYPDLGRGVGLGKRFREVHLTRIAS